MPLGDIHHSPLSRRLRSMAAVLMLVPGLAACAAKVDPETAFSDLRTTVGERVPHEMMWRRGGPEDDAVDERIQSMLMGEVSMDAAVQIGLLNNPGLQVVYAELGVAQADLVQAGLLTNPVFTAHVHPATAAGEVALLEFELIGNFIDLLMLPARQRVAASHFESEKLRVADKVVDFVTDVRKAYVTYQASLHAYFVQDEINKAAQMSHELAMRFHEAGNISELELAEERAAMEDAALEFMDVEHDAADARETLAVLLGISFYGDWSVPAEVTVPVGNDPQANEVATIAFERRLDLQAARKETEERIADLKSVTDWRLWQDGRIGGGAERQTDGRWSVGPSLELALPLFNQGNPKVARAAAEALKAQSAQKVLQQQILSDLRRLQGDTVLARGRIDRYRLTILPLKAEIVKLKQREYNYMLRGAFEVLKARTDERETYLGYVNAIRDYWLLRIDLEHALGGSSSGTAAQP